MVTYDRAAIWSTGTSSCYRIAEVGYELEVCSRPQGNTAQGLCDMVGNVPEYVEDDYHENYRGAPTDGRAWIEEPRTAWRVLRDCDWEWFPKSVCGIYRRVGTYLGHGNDDTSDTRGFRLARDLE
jgi:formylglycine-generating enzyme required for sulfatase activity